MDLLKVGNSPTSEPLLPVDAREKTASGTQSTNNNRQRPTQVNKMTYLRRTIMGLFLCMLVLLGLASAGSARLPCHRGGADDQTAAAPSESFSEMLKAASPSSLNELLHRYLPGRFQNGVFESEHKAMEAVHRENAALATSILQLAKRDGTNTTTSGGSTTPTSTETETTTKTETTTSQPPVDSTTSTTVVPPSTSSSTGSGSSSSSSVAPPPSTSSVPPASTTSSQNTSPTSTHSSSAPGTSSTSTHSSSPPGTSSSPSQTSHSSSGRGTTLSSPSQSRPSSSIAGDTTLTTSTVAPATTTSPPKTSKPVVTTMTSTAPDGVVVTVVATTYVPGDAGETAAPSSTRNPTLQNSAVARRSGGPTLAGAVAFAMLLLVV